MKPGFECVRTRWKSGFMTSAAQLTLMINLGKLALMINLGKLTLMINLSEGTLGGKRVDVPSIRFGRRAGRQL